MPSKNVAQRYCPRCAATRDVQEPWRGWKAVFRCYWIMLVLLVFIFPMAASDYCIMLPSWIGIASAFAPLREKAREKGICLTCSYELPNAPLGEGSGQSPRLAVARAGHEDPARKSP